MEAARPLVVGEVAVLKVHCSVRPGKGFSGLDALVNDRGCRGSYAPLSEWVALLAMRYNRAPLPVSRGLEKALMRQGLAQDPAERGDLARRYLFLGDAEILLAESRKRPIPITDSLNLVNMQSRTETQTQPETGIQYQCP